jgi:hypothetical protein
MQTSKFSLVADAVIDGQSFLARTMLHGDSLGRIDSEKSETLSEDIAALAHKLITMKVADLSNEAELRAQIQTAFALTSLGLEYGSKGNLDKAVSVLLANPIVKFFQIGNTLTDKLLKKASHILEQAVIEPDESLSHLDIDSIRIYNHAEAEFLDALAAYDTTISTAQVTIKNNHPPRAFTNLSDMEIIRQQLDYIEARWTYVQALPLEDIFTIDPPLSIAVDPIQTLTLSLMANLTLYFQPDLQLEADTLSDFRDIIYDEGTGEIRPAPRQRLLDWIENYLEQENQSEEVKRYTVAYWDACLQGMVEPDSDLGLLL